MQFVKATKEQSKLRLALMGTAGCGKTYTSLAIGARLAELEKTSLGVIDTETGSASLYSDIFEFGVLELKTFSPEIYIQAMREAANAGIGVLVIDSLTHAWDGVGGALELKDKAAKRNGGNTYTAWADITPMQRRLVDAILNYPGHVIVTMRSKTEYVLEKNSRGKMAPRKVGMAPIQRQGMEYEFTVVGEIDQDHHMVITKSRCPLVDGEVYKKAGADFADILHGWLKSGTAPVAQGRTLRFDPAVKQGLEALHLAKISAHQLGITPAEAGQLVVEVTQDPGRTMTTDLTDEEVPKVTGALLAWCERKEGKA